MNNKKEKLNDKDVQYLENILNKDSLAELTEQDKCFIWTHRDDCIKYPNSLPKLLQAIDWSNKKEIVEVKNFQLNYFLKLNIKLKLYLKFKNK